MSAVSGLSVFWNPLLKQGLPTGLLAIMGWIPTSEVWHQRICEYYASGCGQTLCLQIEEDVLSRSSDDHQSNDCIQLPKNGQITLW